MKQIDRTSKSPRLRLAHQLPVLLSLIAFGTAHAEVKWDEDQNPHQFLYADEKLNTNFYQLRMKANVAEKDGHAPWSETYWAGYMGGIAWRYQTQKKSEAFTNKHYSREELKAKGPEFIKTLSPAEKLDIINGDYNYPITTRVLKTYGKDTPKWEGICHGWGPAAVNYPEPQNTTYTNKDGIEVPLGSTDVKALMSFYYAWEASQYNDAGEKNFDFIKDANGIAQFTQFDPKVIAFIYRGLGERCERGTGTCGGRGLNPAAFHLALTNLVGNYQRSFIVNVVGNTQVWNQPVYGYESKVLETKILDKQHNSSNNDGSTHATAVKSVFVNTQFYYVSEPRWMEYNPRGTQIVDTNDSRAPLGVEIASKNLAYWLDLDANGEIVAGRWAHPLFGFLVSRDRKSDRIGFAWRASRVPFTGKFFVLNELYKTLPKKTVSYATTRNFTPGLEDTFFEVNASTIPVYDWTIASLNR